ncbi:hypothetical protein [Streptomyces atratus]|uniref:hypothetical protein n=1 Tax=Streptomyces atratus TaxID=1893 RepID=UPI00225B1C43|nr:hypothetical protein [Streptomyces atratus]MCX5338552.1 hypothetical protein [Streptomyces atratus]
MLPPGRRGHSPLLDQPRDAWPDRRQPHLYRNLLDQPLVDDTPSIAFLGLAAGSILYVAIELLAVARRAALKELTTRRPAARLRH